MTYRSGASLAVLADDLTGAHANAARLSTRGRRATVLWHPDQLVNVPGDVVVNMRTRDRAEDPAQLSASWTTALLNAGFGQLELRVDTTLRGAAGDELAGVIGSLPRDPFVVALPAHPAGGRTTVDGIQRVDDESGSYTIPDTVQRLFGNQPAAVVPLRWMHAGPEAILDQLRTHFEAGCRRVLLDVTREEHLRFAAEAVHALRTTVADLITMSSGAWLAFHPPSSLTGVVVGVVASPTSANARQLETLRNRGDVAVLDVDPRSHLDPATVLASVTTSTWAVVLDTTTPIPKEGETPSPGWGASAARAARLVAETLEVAGLPCRGFVATGGDAAAHLVDELEAVALLPDREVEPLCARGQLVGGPWDSRTFVSKGGVLGDSQTLLRLLEAARTPSLLTENNSAKENHV